MVSRVENKREGKPEGQIRMDNLGTLAKLNTPDTVLRQTKQKQNTEN
jgi:hypothetical protein